MLLTISTGQGHAPVIGYLQLDREFGVLDMGQDGVSALAPRCPM